MNWYLSPPWSLRVLVGVLGLLLLIALVRWWREGRGGWATGLRMILLGLMMVVALNPQTEDLEPASVHPPLGLLLDTSGSMWTKDAAQGGRLETAWKILTEDKVYKPLTEHFQVRAKRFAGSVETMEYAKSGMTIGEQKPGVATDLGLGLKTLVSEMGVMSNQAGILVVSDGRVTAPGVQEALDLALARGVPLWTWTLGGQVMRRDLSLESGASEILAFNGAEVEMGVTLKAQGYLNRSFQVELFKGEEKVGSREVMVETNGQVRVSMKVVAPQGGEQRYAFKVPVEADEADPLNNERSVYVRSVGERARVLIAEGQPHWDSKFLVQALKNDPHVELTAVYRLNAKRSLAVVSSKGVEKRVDQDLFPRTREALKRFDLVILGRGAEGFFDSQTESLLTQYVSEDGGSLVFGRGKPYGGRFQPLAKLEPVAWGQGQIPGVRLRPTAAGRDHPIFDLGGARPLDEWLERMPVLDHASVTLGEKPLAVTLATSDTERVGSDADSGAVLMAYQRYGQGRVVSLNAGGLWRWAFRESGQEEGEVVYHKFWVSLMQWLLGGSQFLPGSDVSLTASRRTYTTDQVMQFLIATRNVDVAGYRPSLKVEGGGRVLEMEPRAAGDKWVAEAGSVEPGHYTVTLENNVGQPRRLFLEVDVIASSVENLDWSADPGLMERLAVQTGGRVLAEEDLKRLPEFVREWERKKQLSRNQVTLWDRPWFLTLLVGMLTLEFWLRRKEGLL